MRTSRRQTSLIILAAALSILGASRQALATPGEYVVSAKIGPSFEIQDSDNRFKIAGAFDYELGFGFGFNLEAIGGFGSSFLLQLMPAVKYDIVYFIPGTLYILAGAGYELHDADEQAMGMRFGTGMRLPLKKPLEFITDISWFVTPTGGPGGTPMTFDWLTGIGVRY